MGYYTDFELKQEGCPEDLYEKLESEVAKMNIFGYGNAADGWYENAKWYDYDDDMCILSLRFPDVLFRLDGCGEDNSDIWRHYYKGGKAQRDCAKTVYESFDENKLVETGRNKDETYSCEENGG